MRHEVPLVLRQAGRRFSAEDIEDQHRAIDDARINSQKSQNDSFTDHACRRRKNLKPRYLNSN